MVKVNENLHVHILRRIDKQISFSVAISLWVTDEGNRHADEGNRHADNTFTCTNQAWVQVDWYLYVQAKGVLVLAFNLL